MCWRGEMRTCRETGAGRPRAMAEFPAHTHTLVWAALVPRASALDHWKMYDSYMSELAVSDVRNRLAEVIEESRRSGDPISVTRRGRRVAVILDADAFDELVDAADDVDDRRELGAARAEDDYVPWGEVKAALGLE